MRLVLVALVLTLLTGCSAVDMKQYSANDPRLDLYDYFSGSTKGWGIVQDRKGTLIRQFVVEIMGEITDGGQLVLTETFDWSDGEQSNRTWILSQQDQHRYTGTAEDVVGSAEGILYGNVLNWQYQLNLVLDDTSWEITFDDWMFLQPDGVLLNRAEMSKFGFKLGEVIISFKK